MEISERFNLNGSTVDGLLDGILPFKRQPNFMSWGQSETSLKIFETDEFYFRLT